MDLYVAAWWGHKDISPLFGYNYRWNLIYFCHNIFAAGSSCGGRWWWCWIGSLTCTVGQRPLISLISLISTHWEEIDLLLSQYMSDFLFTHFNPLREDFQSLYSNTWFLRVLAPVCRFFRVAPNLNKSCPNLYIHNICSYFHIGLWMDVYNWVLVGWLKVHTMSDVLHAET